MLAKWGSYSASDIVSEINSISSDISDSNSISGVSEILTLSKSNAEDMDSLKNSVLALQALTEANKILLETGFRNPVIQTWLEEGSIVFKTLITNPTGVRQNVPVKFYLPKEATDKDIIKIDDGLKVGYDASEDAYFVSGQFSLAPNGSQIFAVEVEDIWKISDEEIESLKIQAKELYEPLKQTSYFGQGATIYADIIASLDTASRIQKEAQIPEARIKAYREALVHVNKAKGLIEDIKTLGASASSAGSLFGFVGGVQTIAVWGMVLILVAGFVFLGLYMRLLLVGQSKKDSGEKAKFFNEYFAPITSLFNNFHIKPNKKIIFPIILVSVILVSAIFIINFVQKNNKPENSDGSKVVSTEKKNNKVKKSSSKYVEINPSGEPTTVNVRSGPGFNYDKVSVIIPGKEYEEFEREPDEEGQEWIKIEIDENEKGWVQSKFMIASKQTVSSSEEINLQEEKSVLGVSAKNQGNVKVITEGTTGVNLREGPSTLTEIVTKVTEESDAVEINNLDGWTQLIIDINGKEHKGWIRDNYLLKNQ